MLTSDVALHRIAHLHAADRQREARTERLLRQAHGAPWLVAEGACCDGCCADEEPCAGACGCADGCCADEPCDDADEPARAPWRPIAGLAAGLRAWGRARRPRAPRYA